MSEQKKLSATYKLMRVIGLNYSEEEYGQVSLFKVIGKFFHNIWVKRLEMMMDWPILLLLEKCELFSYVKWAVMLVKMFLWANMFILIYGMLN